MGWMMGPKACIRVDELAATMIDAGLNRWKENTLQDIYAIGESGARGSGFCIEYDYLLHIIRYQFQCQFGSSYFLSS
jgi:hypothetical protein